MSRIGKSPITLPKNVQLNLDGSTVKVKGPKGELSYTLPSEVELVQEDGMINIKRHLDDKSSKSLHGLSRTMVSNMVTGVDTGFKKVLMIEGVGFRAEMKGVRLQLTLGFSHPVIVIPPKGIEFKALTQTSIEITGIDKQLVGEVAAKIRKLRKPEPYKGKGLKYEGEYIRRKAGKSSGKGKK